MNPKRKLRLILLGWMVPFASLLFYVLKSDHLRGWFPFLEFGYFVAFLIYMTRYMKRHPELRPSPEKTERQLAGTDPSRARTGTSILLLALVGMALIILAQRDPLSHAWGRGVTPNPAWISMVRAVAWLSLVLGLAGFLRLGQVWYRNRKTTLTNDRDGFK
jgi:hypothetical protein